MPALLPIPLIVLWPNWNARSATASFLCTQNVDSLHEQAGSQRIMHMHGRLMQTRCSRESCRTAPFDDERLYLTRAEIPTCPKCGALLRPHICWFGEVPFGMDRIFEELRICTVLLTIGSSGVVEPAASFVRMARMNRAKAIYIGPEEPANSKFFDEVVARQGGRGAARTGEGNLWLRK